MIVLNVTYNSTCDCTDVELAAVDVWTALRTDGIGQICVFTYHNQQCLNSKVGFS